MNRALAGQSTAADNAGGAVDRAQYGLGRGAIEDKLGRRAA